MKVSGKLHQKFFKENKAWPEGWSQCKDPKGRAGKGGNNICRCTSWNTVFLVPLAASLLLFIGQVSGKRLVCYLCICNPLPVLHLHLGQLHACFQRQVTTEQRGENLHHWHVPLWKYRPKKWPKLERNHPKWVSFWIELLVRTSILSIMLCGSDAEQCGSE